MIRGVVVAGYYCLNRQVISSALEPVQTKRSNKFQGAESKILHFQESNAQQLYLLHGGRSVRGS